jgi:hypothetical protein
MTDYANDAVTEGALIRLAESTRMTISRLQDALEAAQEVRVAAEVAGKVGLHAGRLETIQRESLKLASGIEFARDHSDIATKIITSISAAHTGKL